MIGEFTSLAASNEAFIEPLQITLIAGIANLFSLAYL
jgi:hypothetical protein